MDSERETSGKFARKLLSTVLFWRVRGGFEVVGLYIRTNQNLNTDEIARLREVRLQEWGKYRHLQRIAPPSALLEFITFAPHLDCGRPWHSTEPVAISQ